MEYFGNETSLLSWRVGVDDDYDDIDDNDFRILQSVVRTSYVHHLKRTLQKNLDLVKQCSDNADAYRIVKNCSASLEEKALRRCMLAKLYQCEMIKIINDIKQDTSRNKVFPLLQEFLHQGQCDGPLFCDKYTQTESQDFTTDSDITSHSLNSLDSSQTQALIQQIVLAAATSLGNTDPTPPCTDLVPNLVKSECYDPDSLTTFETDPLNPQHFTQSDSLVTSSDCCNKINENQFSTNISEKVVQEPKTENTVENITTIRENIGLSNSENRVKKCFKRKHSNFESSLDERLKTFDDLMNEKTEIPSTYMDNCDNFNNSKNRSDKKFEEKLKFPIFLDSVASLYSLDCEISDLPEKKKLKIGEIYDRVFSPEHDRNYFPDNYSNNYYSLSDNQRFVSCRKRIANFVVGELTKYYMKKQIASKPLFKAMAKHITEIILTQSLYPSFLEVKKHVDEFFPSNRVITCELDYKE